MGSALPGFQLGVVRDARKQQQTPNGKAGHWGLLLHGVSGSQTDRKYTAGQDFLEARLRWNSCHGKCITRVPVLFRSDDAGWSWKALDLPWPEPGLTDGVEALACL